jgi:uncharacterized damage-inducible protein DinB
MEVRDLIIMQFEGVKRSLDRTLKGLTQEEVAWRPGSGCNSIGLILFHLARTDDAFLVGKILGGQPVWDRDKWYEKLNLDPKEEGAHYTADQVNCFLVPPLADLTAFTDATRANLIAIIKELTPEQLEKKVETPFAGEVPIANLLAMMIGHAHQHVGEISYLRGVQRGMDK